MNKLLVVQTCGTTSLFSRHWGIQPIFSEVSFGNNFRCDFCWLNDNSDGPEWVLVEIEKPNVKLFNQKNEPSAELNHGIEQVKSWQRYFNIHPAEKSRIFGAVSKFRYILVIGEKNDWEQKEASLWRAFENQNSIEIRSMGIFDRAIENYEKKPNHYWSFEENSYVLNSTKLQSYWEKYSYIIKWRTML
ncbi:Shedu anti-phage system protein SduA domain-containing protein [Acinetobacter nosocomialis]|uniref:Shedu anti-phage system protein SduA domain-containing protein n=1 Tax=Acinetobacter nosocomialis TaxID=106654 RepID=UPI002805FF00|nr:Shedu anti-phage system protein SduA domain-containing protein [Acinetobacter nosocomialis]